ncbi:YfjI family protein [Halomonas almeriensis]|uniref:YfjI family protein n=1 Tax=Halomonas almeriensis TaxID=308163 RepID=UPI0025B56B75|nr:YfjI family protein [Halomonas almeriensis]MDN3553273.1 YfjI family protein [Halomonas almeriensis]
MNTAPNLRPVQSQIEDAHRQLAEEGPTRGKRIDLSPEPLPERAEAPAYPLDALGSILGDAAKRLAHHVQAPEGMAGQSVLAAASLAMQAHCDVQRGSIGTGPVSLFAITVAKSGERKTALDKLALAPIREYEQELREAEGAEQAEYKANLKAWEMQRASIENKYKPKGKEAISDADRKRLSEELARLDREMPTPPPRPTVTFEEPTAEGVYRHFAEGRPTAGLFSGEGIGFFGGHGMREENRGRIIAMLSKLWDGDPITRTRGASGESGILAGRRLSAHLMMQPVVATEVLSDPLLQGQGFLARFLVVQEPSMVGTRLLKGRDLSQGARNDPDIGRYWSTLSELIRKPLDTDERTGELQLRTAKIEGKAFDAWCQLHDGIESQLGQGGQLDGIQEAASKAAENAARIAAVLATVEGFDHPQVEHVERAGRLIGYYLESMHARADEAQQDQQAMAARDLLEWIQHNGGEITADDFNRLHRDYRSARKARSLLSFLVDAGHLEISASNQHGKPRAWREVQACST